MRYKLILNSKYDLELEDMELSNLTVYLNKVYANMSNPTDLCTDYSRSINVPFTQHNNKIFSYIYRTDSLITSQTIDPRVKINYVLLTANNELLLRGYCKLQSIYNSNKNKYYVLNLYSKLAEMINDMKLLTFNPNADVDSKYKIDNPLSNNLMLNRHIVKQSFEKNTHVLELDNKNDLDFIQFYPQYQGKYPDFESDKYDSINEIIDNPYGEQDEHYMREHRSYYTGCGIYCNALWQIMKKKMESITDYKINLDKSWFNSRNPYYTDVIYTVPSLYDTTGETDKNSKKEKYSVYKQAYKYNIISNNDLSNNHVKVLPFKRQSGDYIYENTTKIFNIDNGNSCSFKYTFEWQLFVASREGNWCKIRKDNPLFFEVKAVNAHTGRNITGASKVFMLYSCETDRTTGFDEAIDIGIVKRGYPTWVTAPESGLGSDTGFGFAGRGSVTFEIKTQEPFHIVINTRCANTSCPFETAISDIIPKWDWLWVDRFQTSSIYPNDKLGMTWYVDTVNAECEYIKNIRSNSPLSMYRVFSKDESLFDVLLKYSKMFGLVWDLNEQDKVLNICTRNKYFSNYKILDWTNKVDRNKDFITQPIYWDTKYLNFTYNSGKGQRYEEYENKYDVKYGEAKIDTGYKYNNNETVVIENLNPSMICQKKQSSYTINTYDSTRSDYKGGSYKVLPNEYFVENDNNGHSANNGSAFYFWNGRYEVDEKVSIKGTNGKPLILITDDSDIQIKNNSYCWGGEQFTTSNYYPAISTISKDGKYGIQFQTPKEIYFSKDVVPFDNPSYVYDNFWRDYLDELYSVQNKQLTCYLYLTPSDFTQFSFSNFVVIDNVLYHPIKICDYDISSKSSTKVELLQVEDINRYKNNKVVFPYLFSERQTINLTLDEIDETIYSTSEWSIVRKPYWVHAVKDDNKLLLYSYDEIYKDRQGTVTLTNSEGITYFITVKQKSIQSQLSIKGNNITFENNGGSSVANINSSPNTITIVSKPSWVEIQHNYIINSLMNNQLIISTGANPTALQRKGNIVISNGYLEATIEVTQQGRNISTVTDITTGDIVVSKPIKYTGVGEIGITVTTPKEIDINSLVISKKGIVNFKPSTNVGGSFDTIFTPTDNLGGTIVMNSVDGTPTVVDYVVGVKNRYTVLIQDSIVNGEESTPYFSEVDEGTVLEITPIGENFLRWSDDNTDKNRTITVTSDITLYPIYYSAIENAYQFDNEEYIQFDNNNYLKY